MIKNNNIYCIVIKHNSIIYVKSIYKTVNINIEKILQSCYNDICIKYKNYKDRNIGGKI